MRLGSPEQFFRDAESEYAAPPVWSGELYLEYHRGAYSAQARTKRGNRRSEHLLRAAELWATLASVRTGAEYPAERLRSLWQTVLLQQFHDILPGTSIAWVHQQAEREYARVAAELGEIIDTALRTLTGEGDLELTANAGPVALGGSAALGVAAVVAPAPIRVRTDGNTWVFNHPRITWILDSRGVVVGGYDRVAGRELVDPERPVGVLQLFRDTPREWDAWNIDSEDAAIFTELRDADELRPTDDGAGLVVRRSFGGSHVEQEFRVDAATGALDITVRADWHERQKMLKLAFPLQLRAEHTESEIQFGHLTRSVHANTSWDAAKFETVAHRWLRVTEGTYGVSIANDASYGHDVHHGAGAAGGRHTVARVTLVRAPLFPDPGADQGAHEFRVSVLPGADVAEAIAQGFRLNLPVTTVRGGAAVAPALEVDGDGVVVEAVKLADDGSGDVIVRLYEALGTRRCATIRPGFAWSGIEQTDLLERPVPGDVIRSATTPGAHAAGFTVELERFQLATVRIRR